MENVFRNFYRQFYLKTGGFIPSEPINQNIFPGDFFQVSNGNIIVLGNIFRAKVVDPADAEFGYGIKLNPSGWKFSEGVKKAYAGRGKGENLSIGEFEFSKQVLSFEQAGAFIFSADDPESVKMLNWNAIQQQLIIKLTQTLYSFRNLYMVTETAMAKAYAVAIAGARDAELELATDAENFNLVDLFGHVSSKTMQAKYIEFYNRETKRRPVFFKAKRLLVKDDIRELFIRRLINERQGKDDWADDFLNHDFFKDADLSIAFPQGSPAMLLDMLQANQLNANTALKYFTWGDMNLDDIEMLFAGYQAS